MRVSLFSWDANPAVDKAYRINIIHAEDHVRNGRADKLSADAYQMRPNAKQRELLHSRLPAGRFDTAWGIKLSACYPVWQMRTQRTFVAN